MKMFLDFFKKKYEWLRDFFEPTCEFLFPRYLKIGNKNFLFVTANRITIGRTILVVPFAFVFGWNKKISLGIFIFSVIFDFVDGLVAKIHKKQGHQDNEDLGAFLDAFLDKIFWVSACLIVLAFHDYKNFSLILNIEVYTISSFLMIIEIILGVIRLQDFFANKWQRELDFLKSSKDLRAKMSGKLKMFLESLGLIFLIQENYFIGLFCLIWAIPFGIKSILDKIK